MAISMSAYLLKTTCRKCGIPFGRFSLLLMLILIQNNAQSSMCSSDYEFVTQPSDVTVREGEPASFECTLQSRVLFASASSYWINGKTENVQHHPFVNITTRTDIIHRQITSRLIIQSVQRESNALYKCSIILRDHPNKIFSSDFARLDVLYFLRKDELICVGPIGKDFEEGEQVDIRCEAGRSNPPAIIQWLWPDSDSLNISSMSPVAESTLVANFTVTQSLHNEMVLCLATSSAFPGKGIKCSLGPLKVLHSPLVEVSPYQVEMPWPVLPSMSFQCLVTGYPEVTGYNWFCSPEKAFEQCTSNTKNLTIVVNPVHDGEVLTVTCEAWNLIGNSRNNSIITIRYGNVTSVPDCKSNTPYYQETKEVQVTFLEYNEGDEEGNLKCFTRVKSTDNITFRWSLDGSVICEEQGKYVLGENDFKGTYIIAYSIHKIKLPGIVTCDHRAPSSTEPQINLVACYSSGRTVTDPNEPSVVKILDHYNFSSEKPSEILSTTRMNATTIRAKDQPGTFWSLVWKGALAIVMVLGILLCTILVALGWRKLMASGTYETQSSPSEILPAGSNAIQRTRPQSEFDHINASPLYEIPNESLGIRMENKNPPFQHVQALSRSNDRIDWRRRGNIDSFLEGEESSTDGTRSGCSSSATDVRMSYVYEDAEQVEAHALHHYENRQVVKSVLGNAGSKYFFAKVKENQLNCEADENQENEDSSVCSSE